MLRAAMAHLNLVLIHPFSDGNGRMARCLQTLVLARGGVLDPTFSSIEEYLGRNTQAYYDVLARVGQGRWNPHSDALPWIRFCLTAHYRQARTARRRLEFISVIGSEIEQELARRGLPDRAAVSLTNAAFGLRLRNESYRRDADVSQVVASRDLKALVEAKLIVPHGEKRGRSYEAGAWLLGLRQRFRDASPIPSPFDVLRERPTRW
jgi:Fic family protein